MQLQRLLSVSLLLAPWDSALSFLHHVALPQLRSPSSCSKHDHDQHDNRRKQAASSATTTSRRSLRARAANTDPVARASGTHHPQQHKRSSGSAEARAAPRNDPEAQGLGRKTADKKRGVIPLSSSSSSLTRSEAISSAAATAGVIFSLIASPRQASAAAAETEGRTEESVASGAANFDVGGAEAGASTAKYMVGSDEVGPSNMRCYMHRYMLSLPQ